MSIKITLNTKDFDEFTAQLAKDSKDLKKMLVGVMTATAVDVQTTAKKPGYVPFKTGNLRRSITHSVRVSPGSVSAIIGSNLVYAAIHEFGGQAGVNGSVTIKPARYIQRAIEDNSAKTAERIKRAIAAHLLK